MSVQRLTVDLHIPAHRYLALYEGRASDVQTRSRDGLRVRFPGRILQRFLTHDGVSGTFVISFDNNGKFIAIDKIV